MHVKSASSPGGGGREALSHGASSPAAQLAKHCALEPRVPHLHHLLGLHLPVMLPTDDDYSWPQPLSCSDCRMN